MSLAVNNFFPADLAEQIYGIVSNLRWAYGWKSNRSIGYAHWNYDFAGGGVHNGLDVSNRINGPMLDAWNYIKTTYLPDHVLIRCYANAHTYGVEGYPHTDSKRDQDTTVVVYMNKDWKREWGGETLIYDGDTIETASVPAFNRALLFKGNQWHCARSVTRICPDQRRTLMFKCAKIGADTARDNLQIFLNSIGANDKAHKFGSLSNHLLGTYDLLKSAGQDTDTCLAGGAHSIFGTNAFKSPCLTIDQQGRLEEVIGPKALELVKLFSTINRPKVLEQSIGKVMHSIELTDGGVVVVSPENFKALCAIEAANLADQDELGNYPGLKAVWQQLLV